MWLPYPKYKACDECIDQLVFIGDNYCKHCGKRNFEGHDCGQKNDNKYYKQVISVCEYKGVMRKSILNFKYKGKKKLAQVYAEMIWDKLKHLEVEFDVIASVPIHVDKLRKRGYNQAELIAIELAKVSGKEIVSNNLVRIRATKSQFMFGREMRKYNIVGAFSLVNKESFKDKSVLLIDDIMTTGATVDECARVLLEAGAVDVQVATIVAGKSKDCETKSAVNESRNGG